MLPYNFYFNLTSDMIKKNNKKSEFSHFNDLSNEWWDINGKFKILHTLTPLRINYIKNNIKLNAKRESMPHKSLKDIEILDLGCGGGLICEPLARLGAKVTGVDFVKKNIIIAKKHAKISNLKINYINQNLSSIKINKKFDVVLMLEVIEHMNNWKSVIKKIIPLLKPKGKIILSTINKTLIAKFFAIFLAEEILKWVPKNTHDYNKLISLKELKLFLEKNKLKVTDTTGLIFNPILNECFLSKELTKINYFCSAKKIN